MSQRQDQRVDESISAMAQAQKAAAHLRQLRARARTGRCACRCDPGAAQECASWQRRGRHSTSAAKRPTGCHRLPSQAKRGLKPTRRSLRCDCALRRSRAGPPTRVCPHRRHRTDRCRDLPPSRRHSARDRARRRAGEGTFDSQPCAAAERTLQAAHRRKPRCASASEDAGCAHRLEYDLLTPQEQVLFTRVGIFAGGFSLDAATAVCSGEDLDEIDILDLLASLTDKSLVVADTQASTNATICLNRLAPMRWRSSRQPAHTNSSLGVTPSIFATRRRRPRNAAQHRLDGAVAGEPRSRTGQLSRGVGMGA